LDVRKLNDIKEETDGAASSKTRLLWIIGPLSIGIFLALLWLFGMPAQTDVPPAPMVAALPPAFQEGEETGALPPAEPPMSLSPSLVKEPEPPPQPVSPPPRIAPEARSVVKTLREKKPEASKRVSVEKQKSSEKKSPKRGDGVYTIQVASFSQLSLAKGLANRLMKKGLDAYVVIVDLPSKGTMYRVRIGHFKSRAAAQKAAEQVQQTEGLAFFITTTGPERS
jgi:cell division septation protein DedD